MQDDLNEFNKTFGNQDGFVKGGHPQVEENQRIESGILQQQRDENAERQAWLQTFADQQKKDDK